MRHKKKRRRAPCPTPNKVGYIYRGGAQADARRLFREFGKLNRTYRCACGKFHLTQQGAT